MGNFVRVARADEIAPGAARQVTAGGKTIALFNVAGRFYATDNTCTHRGGPLAEGEIAGDEVTCPWHGAVFSIKTGEVVSAPAPTGVARYNVRVTGQDVEVEVEA